MSTVGGRPSALLKQRTVVVTLGDLTGTVLLEMWPQTSDSNKANGLRIRNVWFM